MATHYTSTTRTYTVKDTYSSYWMQAYLSVTVDGSGNGSWSMTMTNDTGGKCVGSLVFSINGSMIHDLHYDSKSSLPSAATSPYTRSKGFPIKDDSTASGTFKVSGGSFLIGLAVCRSQAAVTYDTDTNRNRLVNGTAARVGSEKPSGGKDWQAYHVKFSRSSWNDNIAGSAPSITNSGNNSFSISGRGGTAGANNRITETKLQWKITGDTNWRTDGDNTLGTTTLSSLSVSSSTASVRLYARTRYKCTYPKDAKGNETYIYSSESNAVINNYQPPALPDTPSITSAKNEGKTKPRFTIKEDWTASWPESSPANASSSVTGYEVVLRKNGKNIYLGDTTSSERTWTIDPIELTLAPKDTIQIGVKPYTTNGAGTKIYNANYKYGPDPAITVQNAAVVRVKVGTGKNTWVEGQVWIKGSDKKWHEADVVKIKTDDGWKESE